MGIKKKVSLHFAVDLKIKFHSPFNVKFQSSNEPILSCQQD